MPPIGHPMYILVLIRLHDLAINHLARGPDCLRYNGVNIGCASPPLCMKLFIQIVFPLFLPMLSRSLKSFGYILAFDRKSNKLMDFLLVNLVSSIQPQASVVYPINEELGTSSNLPNSAKNWKIYEIHNGRVKKVDELRLRHELHSSQLI
jgi:hypothetical protein